MYNAQVKALGKESLGLPIALRRLGKESLGE